MTRREEIVTATLGCRQSYVDLKRPITPDDVADAFGKGAYWADKTMIDKVCDWLQCMGIDYIQGDITDVKWGSMFADLRNYIENGDD